MALNITASGATDVAASAGAILIQVNKALTGTLTITNAGSTAYGTSSGTIATVTNPAVGDVYRYGGLQSAGKITVNPSATTDITVTILSRIQ